VAAEGGDTDRDRIHRLLADAFADAFDTPTELETEVEAGGRLSFAERVA
jgi:hypothetical protein